ncbi:hypothetical protein CYY_000007 [Polysphondylium violaceum]|uniref:EGF-like domain-containing protein n=1 Tax=Polysphondylium violaceum TaxID=133409 RepID=A0A8J4Q2J4_9MYCE|nr:hypothetical protein CYY_000007 [Polysphondylium violaceum]
MDTLRVFVLYIFLSLVLLFNGGRVVDAQSVVIPTNSILKGVEQYADSSNKCLFDFFIKGPLELNGAGILTQCSVTIPGLSCLAHEVYFNNTHYGIRGSFQFDSNVVPYTNIQFGVTKTSDVLTYQSSLVNPDGTPFSYTCEAMPTIANLLVLKDLVPNLNAQFYQSNYFSGTFNIASTLTRPLYYDFLCQSTDYQCVFQYIDVHTLAFTINYIDDFKNLDSGNVVIENPASSSITIRNSLDTAQATVSFDNGFTEFKIPQLWGYYFKTTLSTAGQFPPLNLFLEPLFGSSVRDLTFFVRAASTIPKLINPDGTTTSVLKTIDIGPTSNLILSSTIDPQENFLNIEFETNSRFSIPPQFSDSPPYYTSYPFGLTSYDGYKRHYRFPKIYDTSLSVVSCSVGVPDVYGTTFIVTSTTNDQVPPTLDSLDLILLNETHSVLRIGASDDVSGVFLITVDIISQDLTKRHTGELTKNHLVSGTKLSGVYESIVPFKKSFTTTVAIYDYAATSTQYDDVTLNFRFGIDLTQSSSYQLSDVTELYFTPNNPDVTSNAVDVVFYCNISQTQLQREEYTSVSLMLILSLNNIFNVFGTYNQTAGLYQFPFTLPVSTTPGNFRYGLVINNQYGIESSVLISKFGNKANLNIVNTGIIDVSPPIVAQVTQASTLESPLTWHLLFEDISPIKKVIVGISSEYDMQGKNFTLDPQNQNSFQATLTYEIDPAKCRPMKYWISYIYTEDVLGNIGESVRYSNTNFHPFFKFDYSNADVISLTSAYCTVNILESDPPQLLALTIATTTNASIQNVQAQVNFQVTDGTMVSEDHLPVCYFTDIDNQVLSAVAAIVNNVAGVVNYKCDFIFPFAFGPKALLSIYGLSDIYFNYIGFSTLDLKAISPSFNPVYTVASTISEVVIESTSSLEEALDVFYIYGRGFKQGSTVVQLQMDTSLGSSSIDLTPNITTGSVLVLYNIPQSLEYRVKVTETISQKSSLVLILKGPLPTDSSSSTSLSSSASSESQSSQSSSSNPTNTPVTPTPIVTQTPTPPTCKSDCGASLGYGVCKNTACVCNSPHSGLDCLSTIAKSSIEPNTHKPSVNVTFDTRTSSSGGNPTNTKSTQFSSFIALTSINELENGGDTIVSKHVFNNDKWISIESNSDDDPNVKTTHFKYIIDNSLNTTILSTVQVFSQAKTITFGKQKLEMNPSTVKFTFNITAYPFAKSTNTLQLIMSASLLSDQEVGCSYQEFIQDETDSQYLKIQIDQVALFGRFIGFGIIDGREDTITNSAVDETGTKQTSKSQQTFIGLNVRYFKQYALLDPDFSVLIDTKSASDQENSICTSEPSSSKLTSAQIAGIVVGGVVFLFIIAAVTIYVLSKKTYNPTILKLRKLTKR